MSCDVDRRDVCNSECLKNVSCYYNCTDYYYHNAALTYDRQILTLMDEYGNFSIYLLGDYCKSEKAILFTCYLRSCYNAYRKMWLDNSNVLCGNGPKTIAHCQCKYCYGGSCCNQQYCSCKAIEMRTTTVKTTSETSSTTPTTTGTMYATSTGKTSMTEEQTTGNVPDTLPVQTVPQNIHSPKQTGDSSLLIGGAVGGSIAILLIAMLLVALFIWLRRKRVKTKKERNGENNAGTIHNKRNYDSNHQPPLPVPPPTYDYANVGVQNDGTATYQVSKSDMTSSDINSPSPAAENQTNSNGGAYELAKPIASESNENYFVLEPEDGIFQIQKEICDNDKTLDLEDYVNSDTITGLSDGNEEGDYNRLNERSNTGKVHARNDEYQHVKHKVGAQEEYDIGDYDHITKPSDKTEYDPNDDYDHCKAVAPEWLAQGREDSVDDNYDHLQ